jgi:isoleucyl-tRNA synthetase
VLDIILRNLTLLFSPVLPHTAEEIWGYAVPGAESVELQTWPQSSGSYEDEPLNERWERFLAIRKEVLKALENAKNAGMIGRSLEAAVSIGADDDTITFLDTFGQGLREYFIVSHVSLKGAEGDYVFESIDRPGIYIGVSRAGGGKCARCWVYSQEVGVDAHYADLCNRCLEVVKNV